QKMSRITRHRWGKGFSYRRNNGETVRDRKLRRWCASLAIPPAWTDVEIDLDGDARVHATGRDAAGRKQYIYNPAWRESREQEKYDRIIRFAQRLSAMRRITGQHLRRHDNSREKVLACMVRLIDTAYFRPGNAQYAAENESYGLTTMRSKHLTIEGDELIFRYTGKSGQFQEKHVEDKRLAHIVAELNHIPGREIFKYFDSDGNKVDVVSDDLNAYIHEIMGEDFSAKDFRTWAGTSLAALALDALGVADNVKQAEANIREAIRSVAQRLGNTPAIAKASYIDPRVTDCYLDGRTLQYFREAVEEELEEGMVSPAERAVLKLLQSRLG
ncbi:MAG TPA: DNA topoisomerase IB, partial [Gammaproteobacteria bacterium]|nr:DNA topoisomerase IB [Gammaproteobacteria bacterium]